MRLPQPCSVQHLVSQHLDIAGVPRRSFFEQLACLSPSELERDKLLELSSAAGQEELSQYCSRPRRTALEVWQVAGGGWLVAGWALGWSHTWPCWPILLSYPCAGAV